MIQYAGEDSSNQTSRRRRDGVRRSVTGALAALLTDAVFVPIVVIYAISAAAFGCSGGVSISSGTINPNRALGTYSVAGTFGEAESRAFFGYWLTGNNAIDGADAQALQSAVGAIANTARVTIVPSSILYEETAVESGTNRRITVSISGTWVYDGQTRIRANWGSAFVTTSTFPPGPPFDIATVGTLIEGPQPNDVIFANNINFNELTNVAPGPLNAVFVRTN